MKSRLILSFLSILFLLSCQPKKPSGSIVEVSFSDAVSKEALDGRLLLMFASDETKEPRFQISAGLNAQPIFGIDVDGMAPNEKEVFDTSVFGFPHTSLNDLPSGEYYVQALLHVYETFDLS
ncbi:MAG: hypothetical protein AAFY00_00580, partial [Bacteroidota bacterium]